MTSQFIIDVEARLFEFFGMRKSFFKSAYRTPARTAHLDVKFYSPATQTEEFRRLINDDLLAVIVAILFVAVYIGWHSRSFALGFLGIVQILLSFPLAMFAFTICRVNWFGSFHILALCEWP